MPLDVDRVRLLVMCVVPPCCCLSRATMASLMLLSFSQGLQDGHLDDRSVRNVCMSLVYDALTVTALTREAL